MPTRQYRHIDPTLLLQTVEHDLPMFRDLAGIFVRTVPPMLAQAEAAAARGDWPALILASHSIAGAATVVGAAALAASARRVEAQARSGGGALAGQLLELGSALDGALEEVVHSLCHFGRA